MGDVSRKMTTRTLQRPMRPDSETRDPTGGVTDRRDPIFTISRAGDRPETGPTLTSETSRFNVESGAFLLKAIPALRPSLQEVSVTFARVRANGMANGGWQDQPYWRENEGRGRDRWQWE